MFKRYMIVLAVLAVLSAACTTYIGYVNTQQGEEFVMLNDLCDTFSKGSEEWVENCDISKQYSKISMQLVYMDRSSDSLSILILTTAVILLLMLVSGVLRWIWNGRKQ